VVGVVPLVKADELGYRASAGNLSADGVSVSGAVSASERFGAGTEGGASGVKVWQGLGAPMVATSLSEYSCGVFVFHIWIDRSAGAPSVTPSAAGSFNSSEARQPADQDR
jgi:hypothetical protein